MSQSNHTTPTVQHLYTYSENYLIAETFDQLLKGKQFRLERIVSGGQSTPEEQWYDQDQDEWVLLLKGEARLQFKNDNSEMILKPGDHVSIPAHCLHRVNQTSVTESTVWLALHFDK